jgi:hypothetical protein
LASILSWKRIWHGSLVGEGDFIVQALDSSHTILFVMDLRLPGAMGTCCASSLSIAQEGSRVSAGGATACRKP